MRPMISGRFEAAFRVILFLSIVFFRFLLETIMLILEIKQKAELMFIRKTELTFVHDVLIIRSELSYCFDTIYFNLE